MRIAHRLLGAACLASVSLALGSAARAEEPPAPAPAPERGRVGVGWVVGNGLGVLVADVAVRVAPRVALELELGYHHDDALDETSWGMAPVVRAYLEPDGSTFYVAAGAPIVWRSSPLPGGAAPNSSGSSWVDYGLFANLGHEWRWPSGVGARLGAGVGWRPSRTLTDASGTYQTDGYLGLNLEAGLRYTF